jgi:two-component system, OmpR family, sensor histidine kinase SenX3
MTAVGWIVAALVAVAAAWFAAAAVRQRKAREVEAERARLDLAAQAARAADLAERVRTREEILSTIGDGIVLFAPDGRVVYANPAARDLLGRRFASAGEVTPDSLREAIAQAGASAPGPVECEFETGGRTIEASAIHAGGGAVVAVARDRTEARAVERVRRDFVANASHELKTPVASIQAIAETLRHAAAEDPEARTRFLERLELEATRLARLVGDLLDLSRLEGGLAESEVVDFGRVVSEEVERLRPRAGRAGLRVVVDSADDVKVRGSESDLGLMVHNLLDNAIRYSPDGGEVRATLAARDGRAELRIADTGLGIPARDLARVFERFYRVDPARSRSTGGTGLGLAIVRHVAQSHGGDVEVRSVLGAGSTFIVRLPLAATGDGRRAG